MEPFNRQRMTLTFDKRLLLMVALILCVQYTTGDSSYEVDENNNNNNANNLKIGDEDQLLFSNGSERATSVAGLDANNMTRGVWTDEIQVILGNSDDYSFPMKIFLSTLATTTSLITVSGNLLVIFAFFIDRQIRNPTNYFLLSLSLSDLMIGLVSMPLYTLYLMLGVWPFGKIICNLWLALDYTVCLTSIYTVLLITIDRFCSVKIPAKYRKWRSRNKIIWMVLLTWLIPIVLWFTSIFAFSFGKEFDPVICDVAWRDNITFNIILIVVYFWLTLTVMIILYCFIYQVAKNLEKKSRDKALKFNQSTALGGYSAGLQRNPAVSTFKPAEKILIETTAKDPDVKTNTNTNVTDKQDLNQISSQTFVNKTKKEDPLSKAQITNISPKKNYELKKDDTEVDRLLKDNGNENSSSSICHSSAYNEKQEDEDGTNGKRNNSHRNIGMSRFTSFTSNNEDFSSSYDSQSEYERASSKNKQAFKDAIKRVHQKAKRSLSSIHSSHVVNFNTIRISTNTSAITPMNNVITANISNNTSNVSILQPRPETLAVLSKDSFAEKCARTPCSKPEPKERPVTVQQKQEEGQQPTEKAPAQIPFIEDDYDEVSYILHRRKFGNKDVNREPISEETILIKQRGSEVQKLVSPIATNPSCSRDINLVPAKLEPSPIQEPIEPIQSQQQHEPKLETKPIETMIANNNKASERNALVEKDDQLDPVEEKEKHTSSTGFLATSSLKSDADSSLSGIKQPTTNNKGGKNQKAGPLDTDTSASVPKKIFSNLPSIIKPSSMMSKITPSKPKSKYENRARKALRTITFILGAFVFSWAPYHIVSMIAPYCQACNDSVLFMHFYRFTYFLCYLNSPINPFCYAMANQQFKKTFLRILKGDWRRT